jgi:hypothetical protein
MKGILIFLLSLVFFAMPSCAAETPHNARWLRNMCSRVDLLENQTADTADTVLAQMCLMYINGWHDASAGKFTIFNGKPVLIVFADGVSYGQVARVLVKWITIHPEEENESPNEGLTRAMFDAKLMSFRE